MPINGYLLNQNSTITVRINIGFIFNEQNNFISLRGSGRHRVANALDYPVVTAGEKISAASDVIDYTRGNAIWFDTPTSSSLGQAWKINDFSATSTNPDEVWERQSLPIGNGSFGGSVSPDRSAANVWCSTRRLCGQVVRAEMRRKYWNMNRDVSADTLQQIRDYLAAGDNSSAESLVSSGYRGNIGYEKSEVRHLYGDGRDLCVYRYRRVGCDKL